MSRRAIRLHRRDAPATARQPAVSRTSALPSLAAIDLRAASLAPQGHKVDGSHFGIIHTGFNKISDFRLQYDALGGGAIRGPGGTLSETRPEVYGLTIPGLFDASDLYRHDSGRSRPTLADTVDFANARGVPVSIIVPTLRYRDDIATGLANIDTFFADLVAGAHGVLPTTLTLEIGNEYHGLAPFAGDPAAYGAVASAFAERLGSLIDRTGLEDQVRVAVQMGAGRADDIAIRAAFSDRALSEIDALVFHALPHRSRQLSDRHARQRSRRQRHRPVRADRGLRAKLATGGLGRRGPVVALDMSAWSVGRAAHDAGDLDLEYHDFGLEAAGTAFEAFAGAIGIGVDVASLWGVNVDNLNAVSRIGADGTPEVSHLGRIFEMMSGELRSLRLLEP